MTVEWISVVFGLIGVLIGSLISIWITRHTVRYDCAFRLAVAIKDRLGSCLIEIEREADDDNCPSDIIFSAIRDTRPLVTQLSSFSRDAYFLELIDSWNTFAYGEGSDRTDTCDNLPEYWSASGGVAATRAKAVERINAVLSARV